MLQECKEESKRETRVEKKKTGWHRVYKHKWLAERKTSQKTPSFSHTQPKTKDKLFFIMCCVCLCVHSVGWCIFFLRLLLVNGKAKNKILSTLYLAAIFHHAKLCTHLYTQLTVTSG